MIYDKAAWTKLNIGKPGRDAKLVANPSSSFKTHNDLTISPPSKPSNDPSMLMTERTNQPHPAISTSTKPNLEGERSTTSASCDTNTSTKSQAKKTACTKTAYTAEAAPILWANASWRPRDLRDEHVKGDNLTSTATDKLKKVPTERQTTIAATTASIKPPSTTSAPSGQTESMAKKTNVTKANVVRKDAPSAKKAKAETVKPATTTTKPATATAMPTATAKHTAATVKPTAKKADDDDKANDVPANRGRTDKNALATSAVAPAKRSQWTTPGAPCEALSEGNRPIDPNPDDSKHSPPSNEHNKHMHEETGTVFTGKMERVAPDGSCLYNATKLGNQMVLRALARNWLENNPDFPSMGGTIAQYQAWETGETWDVYCNRMHCNGEWGGLPELIALSQVLKRHVRVFRKLDLWHFKLTTTTGEEYGGETVDVIYESHHFDSLIGARSVDEAWSSTGGKPDVTPPMQTQRSMSAQVTKFFKACEGIHNRALATTPPSAAPSAPVPTSLLQAPAAQAPTPSSLSTRAPSTSTRTTLSSDTQTGFELPKTRKYRRTHANLGFKKPKTPEQVEIKSKAEPKDESGTKTSHATTATEKVAGDDEKTAGETETSDGLEPKTKDESTPKRKHRVLHESFDSILHASIGWCRWALAPFLRYQLPRHTEIRGSAPSPTSAKPYSSGDERRSGARTTRTKYRAKPKPSKLDVHTHHPSETEPPKPKRAEVGSTQAQ